MRTNQADPDTKSTKPLQEDGLQQVIGFRMAKAELAMRRIFVRHAGEPLGLRPVEYAALMLLAANPGSSQTRLAQALSLTAPKMTALVNRLEVKGWIERSSSEQDRRSQMVRVTKAGAALGREATQRIRAAERAELQLTAGEQAMLLELLEKVALGRSRVA
jgi:DNA-binding MarR family transcriptional regulator